MNCLLSSAFEMWKEGRELQILLIFLWSVMVSWGMEWWSMLRGCPQVAVRCFVAFLFACFIEKHVLANENVRVLRRREYVHAARVRTGLLFSILGEILTYWEVGGSPVFGKFPYCIAYALYKQSLRLRPKSFMQTLFSPDIVGLCVIGALVARLHKEDQFVFTCFFGYATLVANVMYSAIFACIQHLTPYRLNMVIGLIALTAYEIFSLLPSLSPNFNLQLLKTLLFYAALFSFTRSSLRCFDWVHWNSLPWYRRIC